ncbi:phytoene/squalene synthase family protein [Acidianus manzaensis]|uniref:Phytoene synthase n=1 Tax=Acidianus manzaensis TaxID=282676 RepID=A0A1W6JZC4_9CREN|nr:phytoene/squalene synthase family protein [Acidianus manzaensis]ARM75585.1 phytoene synthase [Acidianus manzaensis]
MNNYLLQIFKKGSITYYNSSILFPPKIREDVTKLYAFVRVFDDLVDSIPPKVKEFYELRKMYEIESKGINTNNLVLKNFVELKIRKDFKEEWVDAFLDAMESDIYKHYYYTINETIRYMYGSAEVVGLFMLKILNLPDEASYYARLLGRSMQYLNFIRDVKEDIQLGRQYLPVEEMKELGLNSLEECNEAFKEYMRYQINRYMEYQKEAEIGFKYIPSRFLIPIKTASDMYKWTSYVIKKDPCVVLHVKVRPKKQKVFLYGIKNAIGVNIWRSLSFFLGMHT